MCSLLFRGVIREVPEPKQPIPLICDTDMGNDVDDGFALGIIHVLRSRGESELLAVTVTEDHELAEAFVDVLNTFCGRSDVPVGVARNGVEPNQGKFLGLAAATLAGSGRPLGSNVVGACYRSWGANEQYPDRSCQF